MKNCISTILLVIVIISFNCCNDNGVKKKDSKQPNLTNEEIKRLVLLDQDYVYPLEQAKINVLNLATQLLDSKDGIKRSISKIITVPSLYSINGKTSIKTDFSVSKPTTPSLYIANFNEEHGYVIISADKRVTEIIATVGSGTIDSLAHPGLRVFLSNAISHMDEKVAEMESLRDDEIFKSLIAKLTDAFAKEKQAAQQSTPGGRTDIACQQLRVPGAKSNLICADCIYTTSTIPIQSVNTINYIAQPILKTLWDQSAPYNNYQPEAGCNNVGFCGKSSKYNAGCVPISEGQVVAHYFAKKNTSWQTIINKVCQNYTSVEADNVAQLSSTIFSIYSVTAGASRDCNSTTVITGSSDVSHATPIGISPIFGLVQGEWRGWNTNDIRNSLSQNSPVVIKGWVGLDCFIWCWGIGAGHQWVIDGMRDLGVQTTYQVTGRYQGSACTAADLAYSSSFTYTTSYTTSTQIHQNWGWGPGYGSDPNDWYAQDYFKSYGHANYIIAYITAL